MLLVGEENNFMFISIKDNYVMQIFFIPDYGHHIECRINFGSENAEFSVVEFAYY
jgi:hypothetical protein